MCGRRLANGLIVACALGLITLTAQAPTGLGQSPVVSSGGTGGFISSGGVASGPFLAPDGTSGAPAYSFTSEPTLGIYRSAAATVNVTGGNLQIPAGATFAWVGRMILQASSDGFVKLFNGATTSGSTLKVDALPTIASGFGTSPSVNTGSTPFAGGADVGTGGTAFSGVINFNGTAFPSAPFCVTSNTLTNVPLKNIATTTQLTVTNGSNTVWQANDIVKWICVSSK